MQEAAGICKKILKIKEGDIIKTTDSSGNEIIVEIPVGHVWLEGDNKAYSRDSRHYGPVPYALLQGKALFKVFIFLSYKFLPVQKL